MIKKTNKSKVTLETIQQSIENLAIATSGRFDQVDKRFERVESDIVSIKTDIVEIKSDIVGIHQRLNGLDNRLDIFVDHERRLIKVEKVLKLKAT